MNGYGCLVSNPNETSQSHHSLLAVASVQRLDFPERPIASHLRPCAFHKRDKDVGTRYQWLLYWLIGAIVALYYGYHACWSYMGPLGSVEESSVWQIFRYIAERRHLERATGTHKALVHGSWRGMTRHQIMQSMQSGTHDHHELPRPQRISGRSREPATSSRVYAPTLQIPSVQHGRLRQQNQW